MRQWLDGLVIELQRSLDYYERSFSQAPIGHLVVAPTGQPMPGFADYLGEQLGISVRLLDLNAVVDCAEALEPAAQASCFPMLGAALRREQLVL